MSDNSEAMRPASTDRTMEDQEDTAREVHNLPNREAMSILSGLPSIPGLPPNLIGDPSAAPGATDPSAVPPADPGAAPGDTNAIGPINQATLSNLNSSGTTEATGATQDAPIIQQ